MPSPLSMARRRHLLALASSATLLAALPPFALDLKADTASDKAADKATEAPQEGKDD